MVGRPGVVPEPDAIRAYARDRVAAYKYPRRVVLVESLPKGPTGKILKREIDVQAAAREREFDVTASKSTVQPEDAVSVIRSGDTVMVGGFGLVGRTAHAHRRPRGELRCR